MRTAPPIELLARLPEFRLDPAKPPTFHGVIGVDSLDPVWDV